MPQRWRSVHRTRVNCWADDRWHGLQVPERLYGRRRVGGVLGAFGAVSVHVSKNDEFCIQNEECFYQKRGILYSN